MPMVKMALLPNSRFKMTIGIFHTIMETFGKNSVRLPEVMGSMVMMVIVFSKEFPCQTVLYSLP